MYILIFFGYLIIFIKKIKLQFFIIKNNFYNIKFGFKLKPLKIC